jgi:hypothetical protein
MIGKTVTQKKQVKLSGTARECILFAVQSGLPVPWRLKPEETRLKPIRRRREQDPKIRLFAEITPYIVTGPMIGEPGTETTRYQLEVEVRRVWEHRPDGSQAFIDHKVDLREAKLLAPGILPAYWVTVPLPLPPEFRLDAVGHCDHPRSWKNPHHQRVCAECGVLLALAPSRKKHHRPTKKIEQGGCDEREPYPES